MPPTDWLHDAAGKALPHNHPEIADDDFVVRYTTPNDLYTDHDTKIRRINSGAYSESSDKHGGMSVQHEGWMTAAGVDAMHYAKSSTHGAVRIRVGDLRAAGFRVGYDPEPNPYHCAVWDIGSKRRRVQRLAQRIKKCEGEDERAEERTP